MIFQTLNWQHVQGVSTIIPQATAASGCEVCVGMAHSDSRSLSEMPHGMVVLCDAYTAVSLTLAAPPIPI